MSAETLLSRLDKVRQTGAGRWRARCPGHESKSLTLAVRECEDGRVLLKCFAECSVDEVVGAVGLTLSDLFPPKPTEAKRERLPFNPIDVLNCVAEEIMVAWVISRDLELLKPVSQDDFDRLSVCNRRIQSALELINGR